MNIVFKRVGLAIAFSPRLEALLCEAARLKRYWQSELVLIHVGDASLDAADALKTLLSKIGLSEQEVTVGSMASRLNGFFPFVGRRKWI
jgi:hypothetical protein